RALARVIARVHRLRPGRPCHIVAHSLGVAPALAALPHLAPGAVGRIVALTGAAYQGEVRAALATPGGQGAEFINITSRENDPFDFLFERLIAPPAPGDRPIGQGLSGPRAVTLQIDCAATLEHLARIGLPMAPPARRVCHWSAYTRPGAMRAYARLLHRPDRLPLALLRAGLPERPAPRWSRLRPGWGRETGGGGGGLQPT
ncbi:MAG TPA: hypothetical protein DEA05_10695, partial [Rhodobacteraceae bacterium]|nr:hypothetical protein [Paracoccaceae bacterium]